MAQEILSHIRKLNWVLQESTSGMFSFADLCQILGEITQSGVYILNRRGKVLGAYDPLSAEGPKSFDFDREIIGKVHAEVPIVNENRRLGTLVLLRKEHPYPDDELVLAEYTATLVGLEIHRRNAMEEAEIQRERSAVTAALESLSHAEKQAVRCVFAELKSSAGILVASRVADSSNITRSVIVNALRKLESAKVIETKSLGMKGTRIQVTNPYFPDQLNEIHDTL